MATSGFLYSICQRSGIVGFFFNHSPDVAERPLNFMWCSFCHSDCGNCFAPNRLRFGADQYHIAKTLQLLKIAAINQLVIFPVGGGEELDHF